MEELDLASLNCTSCRKVSINNHPAYFITYRHDVHDGFLAEGFEPTAEDKRFFEMIASPGHDMIIGTSIRTDSLTELSEKFAEVAFTNGSLILVGGEMISGYTADDAESIALYAKTYCPQIMKTEKAATTLIDKLSIDFDNCLLVVTAKEGQKFSETETDALRAMFLCGMNAFKRKKLKSNQMIVNALGQLQLGKASNFDPGDDDELTWSDDKAYLLNTDPAEWFKWSFVFDRTKGRVIIKHAVTEPLEMLKDCIKSFERRPIQTEDDEETGDQESSSDDEEASEEGEGVSSDEEDDDSDSDSD